MKNVINGNNITPSMAIMQGHGWNFYSLHYQDPVDGNCYIYSHRFLAVLCNGNIHEGEDNPLDKFSKKFSKSHKATDIFIIGRGGPELELDPDFEPGAVYSDSDENDAQYLHECWTYMDEEASRLREEYSRQDSYYDKPVIHVFTYELGSLPFDELICPNENAAVR
jgi:hypothetical protein